MTDETKVPRYNATASMGVEVMGSHGLINRPQIAYVQEGGGIEAETIHSTPVCMADDVAKLEAELAEARAFVKTLPAAHERIAKLEAELAEERWKAASMKEAASTFREEWDANLGECRSLREENARLRDAMRDAACRLERGRHAAQGEDPVAAALRAALEDRTDDRPLP